MENKGEYLYGLIFTIFLFFILDRFVPDVSLFIRVVVILLLLLIGHFIFNKLFSNHP